MPAQLVALDHGDNILLDRPILLLGRHPECDIQIDSRKISRRHCCIAQVNDYLVVRDLDSTNGIRINGVRVLEGRLRAGDELTLGNHRYRVRWEGGVGEVSRADVVRATARPGLAAEAVEDEALESAEEPVPLDEPASGAGGRLFPRGALLASAPSRDEPPSSIPTPPHSPLKSGSEEFVLPDHLDLAPPSDIRPPPTPAPS